MWGCCPATAGAGVGICSLGAQLGKQDRPMGGLSGGAGGGGWLSTVVHTPGNGFGRQRRHREHGVGCGPPGLCTGQRKIQAACCEAWGSPAFCPPPKSLCRPVGRKAEPGRRAEPDREVHCCHCCHYNHYQEPCTSCIAKVRCPLPSEAGGTTLYHHPAAVRNTGDTSPWQCIWCGGPNSGTSTEPPHPALWGRAAG